MIAKIDKSELSLKNKELDFRSPEMVDFIDKVSMAKPLLEFKVNDKCVGSDWTPESGEKYSLFSVKVYQDGEHIGAIGVTSRYRRGRELVYFVESFRISKDRGHENRTTTNDIRTALRIAKRELVARQNTELVNHIRENVKNRVEQLNGSTINTIRYTMSLNDIAMEFLARAYNAHVLGSKDVTVPVRLSAIKDFDKFVQRMTECKIIGQIVVDMRNNRGYGVKLQDDGQIVCVDFSSNTCRKYGSYDELPDNIASKYAVFKVLEDNDAQENIGVKLGDNFFYVCA